MYSRKARVPAMNQVSWFAGKHYNTQQWASYSKHFILILHNKIKVNIQENQERQKKKYYDHQKNNLRLERTHLVLMKTFFEHYQYVTPLR
jgi:hypothetical protein